MTDVTSNLILPPDPETPSAPYTEASFIAKSRKALAAGLAGAGAAAGPLLLTDLSAGTFTSAELWPALGAAVAGFVVAAAVVYQVPNAPSAAAKHLG